MRLALALSLAVLAACSARFVDERAPRDFAVGDPDLGALPSDGGAAEDVIARGRFTGRAGHAGAGGATLVTAANGRVELRFDDDFAVSPVPGPVVVLTARESLGTALTDGDRELGVLGAARGAQTYTVGTDGGERYAFIFCKPFGVEVARALLVEETP